MLIATFAADSIFPSAPVEDAGRTNHRAAGYARIIVSELETKTKPLTLKTLHF
jgi:hypothetical protein